VQREREEEVFGARGLWEAVEGMVDLDVEEEGEGEVEEGSEEESY
jgi:hypothetical protein